MRDWGGGNKPDKDNERSKLRKLKEGREKSGSCLVCPILNQL